MNLLDYYAEFKLHGRQPKSFFFHPDQDDEGTVEFSSSEYGALSFPSEQDAILFVKQIVDGLHGLELKHHVVGLMTRYGIDSGDVYIFVGNRHDTLKKRCAARLSFNLAILMTAELDPDLPSTPVPEQTVVQKNWFKRLLLKIVG